MSEQTQWTLIVRAQGEGEEARRALGELVRAYQRTVRLLVSRQPLPRGMEVEDVVQDFFQGIVRRGDILRIDPDKGRFRGWLTVAVRHHVANARRTYFAQRKGNKETVSVDFNDPERADSVRPTLESSTAAALRELLRAEALDVCDETIRRMTLKRRKPEQFRRLARLLPGRQLDPRPLRDEAAALGMAEATLRDKMNDLRAEFRNTLCEVVADGLQLPSGEDPLFNPLVRQELEELFNALGAPRDSCPPSEPNHRPPPPAPKPPLTKASAEDTKRSSNSQPAASQPGAKPEPKPTKNGAAKRAASSETAFQVNMLRVCTTHH